MEVATRYEMFTHSVYTAYTVYTAYIAFTAHTVYTNDDVLSWIFDHSWGTGTPPQSRNWGQQVGMELVFGSTQPLIVLIRPPSAFNSIQETHLFSSHSLSALRCILNQNLDSILAFQTLLHIFNIVLLFLAWITKDVNNISQAFYNDLLLEPATWGKNNWNKHFQAFLVLFVLFWVGEELFWVE